MFKYDLLLSLEKIHRASHRGAFFIVALFFVLSLLALPVFGQNCQADRIDEKVAVSRVVDGDTLRLKDGRMVRLIGINTPELARKNRPAEPLATKARQVLKTMLEKTSINGNIQVGLRYGENRKDRYGRELAHVFLSNGASVEAQMLSAGMAAQIVVPPNTWNMKCYHVAERSARLAKKGVWNKLYLPVPVTEIEKDSRGFRIISGKVIHVGESKRSIWLNFTTLPGDKDREGVAVRISKKNMDYFNTWDPKKLKGKEVIVRGWVYPYKKQLVMQLRHPLALEVKTDE